MAWIAPHYEPTPEEIAAQCDEVQAMWSDSERRRRAMNFAEDENHAIASLEPPSWLPPMVHVADLTKRYPV